MKFHKNKGFSLLSVLVFGTAVAVTGMAVLKKIKQDSVLAQKTLKTKETSDLVNNIVARASNKSSCAQIFESSLIIKLYNDSNISRGDKISFETSLQSLIGGANKRIKFLEYKKTGQKKNKLKEVSINFEYKKGNSKTNKTMNLFVSKRGECLASFDKDILRKNCKMTGGEIKDGVCLIKSEETTLTNSGSTRVSKHKNLRDVMCETQYNISNIANENRTFNCKKNKKQTGCYINGEHIRNGESKTFHNRVGQKQVGKFVNTKISESAKSQSIAIASHFQGLYQYASYQQNQGSFSSSNYFQDLTGDKFSKIAGLLGGGAKAGALLLKGSLLGPAGIIGAGVVLALTSILKCSSTREVISQYSCNAGSYKLNHIEIKKKKFRCKRWKCKCRWRHEKNVSGLSTEEVFNMLASDNAVNTSNHVSVDAEEFEREKEAEESMLNTINSMDSLASLYDAVQEDEHEINLDGDSRESHISDFSDATKNAFYNKENEIWKNRISEIELFESSRDNSEQDFNRLISSFNRYLEKIKNRQLKNRIDQIIANKRKEIEDETIRRANESQT